MHPGGAAKAVSQGRRFKSRVLACRTSRWKTNRPRERAVMSLVKTIERHCDKMVEEKQATIEMPTVKLTNTIL